MSFQSYFSLVSKFQWIYVGLAIFIVCCISCSKPKPENYGPSNTRLISTDSPEKLQASFGLTDRLDESLDVPGNWFPILRVQLHELSKHVDCRIKKSVERTDFEAPNLKYSGVDRPRAETAFTTSRIEVSRWRYSKEAPLFETDGLQNLVDNMYKPWDEARKFRTKLTPTKVEISEKYLKVTVVARTFGEIRENVGLESTSMCSTRWKIDEVNPGNIELSELQIIAHEEVKSASNDGLAFQDITENVLQHDDVYSSQLNIGVDEWAKLIPGIDITGNLGIAIGDPNGDGLEDIYLCQPVGLPNILLSQNPDGTVDNTAKSANVDLLDGCRAALFVDLDNDGDEDLAITTSEELLLFSNDGKGNFLLEHKLLAGHGGGSISAADFDNDGDLDLYICKYNMILDEQDLLPLPDSYVRSTSGGRNVLLRNEEGWSFVDVTDKVGLRENNIRHTRCAIWCDYDLDGDQDLMLANEFGVDVFYQNNDGWFIDINKEIPAQDLETATRSCSFGEFNGDGHFDFFMANNFYEASYQFLPTDEQRSSFFGEIYKMTSQESRILYSKPGKKKSFTEYQLPKPIFATQNSFSSVAMDFNNDGFDDLMLTNGWFTQGPQDKAEQLLTSIYLANAETDASITNFPDLTKRERFELVTRNITDKIRRGKSFGQNQQNVCLLSMGPIGFANYSASSGIDFPDDGRAIASTDWDHDGDLDLIVTSRTAPMLRVLGNQIETENQFVGIQLRGTKSNSDAIGARVELYLKGRGRPLIKSVTAGSGTLAQSSKRLHFGIPKDAVIQGVIVHWPLGEQQSFSGIKPGTRYRIVEGESEPAELTDTRFDIGLFKEIEPKPSRKISATHSLLNPPMRMPRLQFQSERKAWVPLQTIDERRMAVVFIDDSNESKELLREFGEEASELAEEKIDVVAIYLDKDSPDMASSHSKVRDLVENANFPFRYGAASEGMMLKMEILYGQWLSDQRIPTAPFGWLVDSEDHIRVFYPTQKISADQVQLDFNSLGGNYWRCLKDFSLLPGYWVNPKRIGNFARLQNRFEEIGSENDGEMFAELSKASYANQLCRRAVELEAQGDGKKAREAYSAALEKDPRCELACVGYGNLRLLDSTMVKDSVDRQSMLNEAELLFNRAIRINPTNTKAILGRAKVLKHREKVIEAIDQLKEYLEIYPERWEVHAEIGRMYYYIEEYRKATEYLLVVWENRRNLNDVAAELGFIYLNKGSFEDARSFLRYANRLQPSDLPTKRHLAHCEFLTGNFGVAIEQLEQLAELAPNETLLKYLHAWVLATSPFETERNGKKSLEIVKPLLAIYDDSPVVFEIAAAAYAELGDFDEALLHQQKAVDLITDSISSETYGRSRTEGLNGRLELYKRKRPYRMADIKQIPIPAPGQQY